MLHLLDCAELGGFWDEDLRHPSSKFFLTNFVVPLFCGAGLCDVLDLALGVGVFSLFQELRCKSPTCNT